MTANPLLESTELPPFSYIKPEHIEPAIDQVLADARAAVETCLQATNTYTWDNLVEPLEVADNRISKAWSPVSHLNSVMNNDELRAAYNACIPKLSAYSTEMGQHEGLFKAYSAIASSPEFNSFNTAQKKVINNALRDFKLSGIALDDLKKQRYKEISQELSKLASQFEENVLDATNAWSKLLTDEADLTGLPATALQQAKQAAELDGKSGWLISLQFPSFHAVMTYADNRDLRREHYEAYSTKASDQGPHACQWDNTDIMEKLLALRHEKAQLLGFANFAELSLATKMAEKPQDVVDFLENLANKSLPQAKQDLADLRAFAQKEHDLNDLQPWDIGYYSEKMRQHFYQLSQEEVKSYFPITRVLPGLFAVVEKLYGLKISEIKDVDAWHPDVKFFQILDKNGQQRGRFYLDLYARAKKRGGAWMDDCVGRKQFNDHLQTPVAYLTCNFTPPVGDEPALLTHDEVTTLFHEFGHGLHHMLTQVDYLGVSGINGVEWDAVELPSQFMENWCWEKEALQLLSGHYQTGETLPDSLFDKMIAAKNFQAGMIMVRQLEFSLFDFLIHLNYDPKLGGRIYETLNKVREQVAVVIPPAFNRFAHSFGHIFAGGYCAGYYSYKWAEVLSSDAYSLFEEQGIFNPDTGNAFLTNILERGGSQYAMELFINFRGRKPTIDALLRHNGIGQSGMKYKDLRDFIAQLEKQGELKRITVEIDPYLEMTEICDRVLKQGGPAILFENPKNSRIPVLCNLFGTTKRVAMGMGAKDINELRGIGELLAYLKEPEPPKGMKDALEKFPVFKQVLNMAPKVVSRPVCQETVIEGDAVDLSQYPIQTCWPDDAAPLITWPLVITKGPHKERQNLGIYRQQVIGKNKVIMRWLTHRGGALDFKEWRQANSEKPFPVAVALGADPATILGAVTPVPDSLSEYAFAGLLRGSKTEVSTCLTHGLQVPANAEIVLEGYIYPGETAQEGPFGDHTGYYNEVDEFPVFTIERITQRHNPIYHSTYTGRPPDEPAILGVALNEVFVPILQKQFPEITDFYLPPEGCSYRMAVISMKKQYAGHAKRVMFGTWSFLRQFMYTKFVIVVDDDINVRKWEDVIWAITTRMDPARDLTILENTPIDYLDFASPVSGLGSKVGFDATNKWPGETSREWGKPIEMPKEIKEKIDTMWGSLFG